MESTKDLKRVKELVAEDLELGEEPELEPELEAEEEHGTKEQLGAEEYNEPENELISEKEYGKIVILTSLVLIHDLQMGMCLICTLFPLSRFFPTGLFFLAKVLTRQMSHIQITHLMIKTGPDLEMVHKPPPGALTEPWKLPLGELARPNHIRLVIHQESSYFEGLGRAKLPKEPANWMESNLKQFGRFTLSEPTNPDRSSSSHALMFSNTHLKTTCCFRMPKTASNPVPRIGPRRSHLPYTDLPYLDQGAFTSQRPYFPQLLQVLETLQDNQRLLRTRTFLPKLSRYKKIPHFPHSDHLEELGERANQITMILIQAT